MNRQTHFHDINLSTAADVGQGDGDYDGGENLFSNPIIFNVV